MPQKKRKGGPFTRLAKCRQAVWEDYKRKRVADERQNTALLETIVSAWQKDGQRRFPQGAPEFTGASIDQETIDRLYTFVNQNGGRLDCARTLLFALHYHAKAQLNGIDDKKIGFCDRLFKSEDGAMEALPAQVGVLLESYLATWASRDDATELIVTSQWLALWFGLRLLESHSVDAGRIARLTPHNRARYYVHFSAYFLYLIHIIRCYGQPTYFHFSDITEGYAGYMDASLFLLADYAHHETGLSEQVPLYRVLTDAWASEALLYSIRKGYRDHLHHVWNVCLLGLLFFEAGMMQKLDAAWETYPPDRQNKIKRNWILAGLLHDIGYALDLNRYLIPRLKPLRCFQALRDFLDGLHGEFNKLEKSLSRTLKNYFSFADANTRLDHGVTSAMILLNLECADETPHQNAGASLQWIEEIATCVEAIGVHNLRHVPVNPVASPLAFLLLLCDHIQEWDRPRIETTQLGRAFSGLLANHQRVYPECTTVVNRMRTNLVWQDNAAALPDAELQIALDYKSAAKEQYEPAVIWFQNSLDFQRVDMDAWPDDFEIVLRCVHPHNGTVQSNADYLEMDLFEDFIREQDRYLSLLDWLHASRNGCNGVHYEPHGRLWDEEAGEYEPFEIFSWHFACGGRPCRTKSNVPADLYGDYLGWKKQRLREAM